MRIFHRKPALQRSHLDESTRGQSSVTPLDDHLRRLMRPISRGSQDEFVSLFEHTCGHVRARLDSRLRDQQLAVMVFAATYVEVWWLAGCHNGPDLDVLAWINKIVDRRVADALRRATPKAPLADAAQVDCAVTRARRAAVELATLLGRPVDTWIPYDLATTALEAEVRGMA